MSDTSVPEDNTATDDVNTPIPEDTETPEPAADRKFAFLSRHIAGFRALRLGGAFTVAAAIILTIIWWIQLTLLWGITFPYFLFTLAILALWPLGAQLKPLKRTFATLTTTCTIIAIGVIGQQWLLIHEQTSIWIGLPPVQALTTLGLGVFIASDVVLRGIRTHQNIPPGDPTDPARYRPIKHNNTTPSKRWTSLLRWIALALTPVTAAATAIALVQASAAPVNQTAPLPEGPLPERFTGIGTTLAWTRDVPGLLATASGAAGPVILTPEGLTGLNPTDGTTLWTYHRKNARYAERLDVESEQGPFGRLSGSYLVSSPNGRYVALRIKIPDKLARFHTNNAVTIVVDTLTGHVTNEHPSSSRWNLQLTDSAILDGTTAYNLDDGKVRWNLKPLTKKLGSDNPTDYSGPAGHRSFILSRKFTWVKAEERMSKSLTLMSDADPADTTTVENIATDILTGYPVIVGGRTAQYTKALVVEREEGETPGAIQAQETRVMTLDSLAGLEEMKPIEMGKTIGLNGAASHASGALAAYSAPEDGKIKFRTSGADARFEYPDGDKPAVGTVFDPTTNTATPASQYPGMAAAMVGITPAAQGEALSAEIVMRPGDGSTGASIPLDLRTMLLSPFKNPNISSPSLLPSQLPRHTEGKVINVINTPKTTLVTLRTDDDELFDPLDWYSQYFPLKDTGYEYAPSYRLHGLTGDAS